MKAIQSIWTKPIFEKDESIQSRFSGGWLTHLAFFASTAYSALQIKKYYNRLELITDSLGKRLFVDLLEIPYDEVQVSLDFLTSYDTSLWSLGKIKACAMQQEPFIHFDTDLFIWEKIPVPHQANWTIVQNLERGFDVYPPLIKKICARFPYVPPFIRRLEGIDSLNVYNTGIIGSNNPAFIQSFSEAAFNFVDANHDQLVREKNGLYNIVFEQLFLTYLAEDYQQPISCYSPLTDIAGMDLYFRDFKQFVEAPQTVRYIHLYGTLCKEQERFCIAILGRLQAEHPAAYKKLMRLKVEDLLLLTQENAV